MAKYVKDPWAARNSYVRVLLNRSDEVRQEFLAVHALRPLKPADEIAVWKLLELQRHAMLMYTSCGWFFDELSSIETVQIIQYAARSAQLAQELFGDSYESHFVELLEQAKSNIRAHRDGRWIYENFAKPALVDLPRLAAHYAVSSLFEEYTEQTNIYGYIVGSVERQTFEAGRAKLA